MKIFVIKNKIQIGTLWEDGKGNISFGYFPEINKDQYLVGLNEKINKSNKLFPVFENLLPEHEQLEYLRVKYSIKRQIELLLYLENIHGSFEFYNEGDFSKTVLTKQATFKYIDAKHEILNSDYSYPQILMDYQLDIPDNKLYPKDITGSKIVGLSGYQYKFSIHKNDSLKIISFDESENSDYMMKPYNLNYSKFTPKIKDSIYIPYLLINEHIFMTLARDFGFDVPYNAIIKHNDDYHYIIKRYDRYNGLKIDHHEVLTLMNKSSTEKYNVSCKEVVELISKYLNEYDMIQLFRFIVFSIVIGHGDLHAKNISLIYTTNLPNEKSMTLSPSYDISTVKIYQNIDKNDIGMMIKNKNHDINIDDLLWLANIMNVDSASTIIEEIALKFIKNFRVYIEVLPKELKELRFFRKNSIYSYSDTLEKKFIKFYENRCDYIRKYLHYSVVNDNESLWE